MKSVEQKIIEIIDRDISYDEKIILIRQECAMKNRTLPSPVLIGHTKNIIGANYYKVAEAGTPVYDFDGRYFIELEVTDEGAKRGLKSYRQYYYKETLKPQINFLSQEQIEEAKRIF